MIAKAMEKEPIREPMDVVTAPDYEPEPEEEPEERSPEEFASVAYG